MNEIEEGLIQGARLRDLFRPRRLFVGLAVRPGFVTPALLLCVAATIYSQVAVGPALPRVIPGLLERSVATESELARSFRWMVLVLSWLLPMVFVGLTAFAVWIAQKVGRGGQAYFMVLSLVSHASLWAALGLLVKALLVPVTGNPEPPVNLALLLERPSGVLRLALAFTNPFLVLAAAWTVRGLRTWGTGRATAVLSGALPWAVWILFFTLGSGGTTGSLAPAGPVSYEGWRTLERDTVTLRYPGRLQPEAEELATILDGFTKKLAGQIGFDPEPIRVHVFPNHQELERAAGDFLHVKVTGSIRGRDLLYLEMPGRSVALPKVDGLYEAVRYVALMHLPFASGVEGSPRWFIEGLAHAAAKPYSPALEREYRDMVRRLGVTDFDRLQDPQVFRTPDGPVLARSVLDHLVLHHGTGVLEEIREDMRNGSSFRDALFSRTRLTTSALEAGWQDAVRAVIAGSAAPVPGTEDSPAGADPGNAPDSTAAPDSTDFTPFLPRR